MKNRVVVAATLLSLPVALAHAGPADYVFVPSVTYGEREIDFKMGTVRRGGDEDGGGGRESAASLGFGYGATQWWFTEFYAKYERNPAERRRSSTRSSGRTSSS